MKYVKVTYLLTYIYFPSHIGYHQLDGVQYKPYYEAVSFAVFV